MTPERKTALRAEANALREFATSMDVSGDRAHAAELDELLDALAKVEAERDDALARANKAAELAAITHGHNVKMHGERAELRARIAKLEAALREIRDNYDCDDDAHRHGTRCRCCIASAALAGKGSEDVSRVVVTGGRDYQDRARVFAELDKLQPTYVAQGGAAGADRWALEWAQENGVACGTHKADRNKWGRGAGPIRNSLMLAANRGATVLSFPGGKGTADCVRKARELGMNVIEVLP